MRNTVRLLVAMMCMLALLAIGFAMAESTDTPAPSTTPTAEELGKLTFLIDGPDESMPLTVQYSDFQDGKFSLENLDPGTYTVTEVDPDKLLENYSFNVDSSVQQVTIEVKADEKGAGKLTNVYERTVEVTPTPSPEPSETPTAIPTATPSPTPGLEAEKTEIPVTKIWDDNNNEDRNRPERVIVHLLANGVREAQAVLSAANGWSWRFTDLPKYRGGREITYTVEEDSVPHYTARIDNYTITNVYTPETMSVTVMKVWIDNDNQSGLRPSSVTCRLNNGISVVLDDSNNWTATVDGLPATVNGQPAVYTWTEQEVLGYEQAGVDVNGTTTVFTNALFERGGDVPEEKKIPTKRRGNSYIIVEDYGTPLGVEVDINHVGDCFD